MTPRDFVLALIVVLIWGTNFVVIKFGIAHVPPVMFAALRFASAVVPAIVFVRRPAGVSWKPMAAYGLLIGAGQFVTLYVAMQNDITPGLASIIVQTQVFFTLVLSVLFNRERVRLFQIVALLISVAGILIIAAHTDRSTTPLGLVMGLVAALCWGIGNLVGKRVGRVDPIAFQVWSSLYALPALFTLAFLHDGPRAIANAMTTADLGTWAAVVWQGWGNTLFGYGIWAWLLARHPAPTVVPIALLVPVVGLTTAAIVLGEPMQGWKIWAAMLVIVGLALNFLWPRIRARLAGEQS